jgi:hypothetical protein
LASESESKGGESRKTEILRRILALTHQEVLLVDLDGLAGLLGEKERLIESLRRVDEELAGAAADDSAAVAEREEQARLLGIVLENEAAVEARIASERERLRGELRALERETRMRKYLERPSARRIKVDLTR